MSVQLNSISLRVPMCTVRDFFRVNSLYFVLLLLLFSSDDLFHFASDPLCNLVNPTAWGGVFGKHHRVPGLSPD